MLYQWLECSPMAQKTWVQSQVESYQRFKKWYLMLPCLILSIKRCGLRVKRSNPGKGVVPSPTPWCSSYQKRAFGSASTMVANFTLLYIYIYIYIYHLKEKPLKITHIYRYIYMCVCVCVDCNQYFIEYMEV